MTYDLALNFNSLRNVVHPGDPTFAKETKNLVSALRIRENKQKFKNRSPSPTLLSSIKENDKVKNWNHRLLRQKNTITRNLNEFNNLKGEIVGHQTEIQNLVSKKVKINRRKICLKKTMSLNRTK